MDSATICYSYNGLGMNATACAAPQIPNFNQNLKILRRRRKRRTSPNFGMECRELPHGYLKSIQG